FSAKATLFIFHKPTVLTVKASPPKFLDKMSTIDAAATEATFGFGDITFKSIVCAGGEVEISGSSMLAEHSIVLCQDQTTKNTYETEDSVISDSMIVQSCDAHIEHPYYNPERGASSVNIDSACLISTVTQNDLFGAKDVTFKSFNCDGGEVEVSDTTRLPEETIPLPEVQLEESLQCNSVNSSIFSDDCSQPCQVEHIDHPYYSGKNDVAPSVTHMSTFSETPDGVEKTADRLTDITFKSFTCTGGEIEVSDGTELADETIPLLMCQFANSSVSDSDSINLSTSAVDYNLQYNTDHLDHPYCHIENSISSQSGKLPVIQEPLPCCLDELNEAEQTSLLEAGGQTGREGDGICTGVEVGHSDAIKLSEKTSPLPKDQTVICQSLCNNSTSTRILQGDIPDHCEQSSCHLERDEVLLVTDPPGFSAPLLASTAIKAMKDVSLNCQVQETSTSKDSLLPEDLCLPSVCQGAESSDCRQLRAFEGNALPVAEQVHPQCDFNVPSRNDALESNEAKHSAVDSTGNAPVVSSSAEKPPTDNPSDVLKELSEFPSVAKSMQLKILSPFVRGNSLARVQAYRALDQFLAEDSALEDEKSLLAPANPDPTGLWPGVLESPMPCPLFNSTTLGTRDCDRPQPALVTEKAEDLDVKPCTMPLSEVEKAVLDRPLIPEGPLQQQLRQMAEFLIFASGRMDTAAVSVPAPPPPTHTVKSGDPLRTESHSVCVGTSPVKLVDHSLNTSGQFERKREFSVADNCTITDPLLWNVPPGSLECLPRPELEQRLRSSMIMVEALVQQLAAARTHGGPTAGPAPSDMREKLVQTDHTELNQVRAHLHHFSGLSVFGQNSVMEQVRTHCAMQISELEESVGSHQELMAALTKAYPEQVHCCAIICSQLHTVWGLLQRTAPVLLKLNEKAAAALTERDQHASARDHAVEEREQIKEDLNEANLSLQDAREQISDLNLQVTIMTSEMGVLRQKLSEGEEERAQLERKVTELSATVSSTLASYTFLEQALGAETTKYDLHDRSGAIENLLEVSLDQSQQRVCELSEALAHREEQLNQLQALSHTQSTEIKQLQDVCTQLNGVQEMNEFLQMENELAREQVAESEKMLRANLQGLRERNIQCEDLKAALGQLQLENKALQVELESTSSRASATQLELGEKLAQAVTDVTLLHHTLRGLTNELHATLSDKSVSSECHHPSSSFVDSIMVALTLLFTFSLVSSDTPEPQCEGLFSEMSAFTRIAAITPKNDLKEVESEPQKQQNNVTELLADLGKTVSELVSTLKLVQQHKDAQLEVLHNTISGLQEEQQAAVSRHKAEVWELKDQLSRLNNQVQRGNVALQQKAQDEKAVTKLLTEVNDARELLNKHKTENNELFKEVSELRRALQQSQVEAQVLREELRKAGSQSATPAHFMDEKICLLKEVERLKGSLQEVEQARAKLLERAKRHQMIHQTNQQKMENELRILDNMIDTVRKVRGGF
uniref:Si:dkey-25o16.4 n=1 Tax=Myripristis murdjan TaxID=586833 RepID=A0A667ZWQ4_9TELE